MQAETEAAVTPEASEPVENTQTLAQSIMAAGDGMPEPVVEAAQKPAETSPDLMVPSSASEYQFELAEELSILREDPAVKDFIGKLHESGVPQKYAKAVLENSLPMVSQLIDQHAEHKMMQAYGVHPTANAAREALKDYYPTDEAFKSAASRVNRTINAAASASNMSADELNDFIDTFGSSTKFFRAMDGLGRLMGESRIPGEEPRLTSENARDQIRELQQQAIDMQQSDPRYQGIVNRIKAIAERMG